MMIQMNGKFHIKKTFALNQPDPQNNIMFTIETLNIECPQF